MTRTSRFVTAAAAWLTKYAPNKAVSTDELWRGLEASNPELTTASEQRKTPRTTCMRDLRTDKSKRFFVDKRTVRLVNAQTPASARSHD